MCFHLYRNRIPVSRAWLAVSLVGFFGTRLGGKGFAVAQALFGARGDLSYGIYLYGFPIQQLVVHYGGAGMHPLAVFALTMPALLLASAGSGFLVERPFLVRKARAAAA